MSPLPLWQQSQLNTYGVWILELAPLDALYMAIHLLLITILYGKYYHDSHFEMRKPDLAQTGGKAKI